MKTSSYFSRNSRTTCRLLFITLTTLTLLNINSNKYNVGVAAFAPTSSLLLSSSNFPNHHQQSSRIKHIPPPRCSTTNSNKPTTTTTVVKPTTPTTTLPSLFPSLIPALTTLQLTTPTPIQAASAQRASLHNLENLLLIAATGSGKTMAYLLPVLERVVMSMDQQQQQQQGRRRVGGTVLVVAPTRELALQLVRATESILSNIPSIHNNNNDRIDEPPPSVVLAVKGVSPPTTEELTSTTVLIGTPSELFDSLTSTRGGQEFIAGDALMACVLDEVDVLFPNPPKELRTSLDTGDSKRKGNNKTPRDERRQREQKRKITAAKRSGTEFSSPSTKEIVGPTERLLKLIASRRQSTAGGEATPCQILAGSATASRKTLDRLNRAMYSAAVEASSTVDLVWNGSVTACRPVPSTTPMNTITITDTTTTPQPPQEHTIRTVTVPSQVQHQYLQLEKSTATSPTAILTAVSQAATRLQPKRALLFLCGEFSKTNAAPSTPVAKSTSGKRIKVQSSGGRKKPTVTLKQKKQAAILAAQAKAPTSNLSARTACSTLQKLGIDAKPLHVALGLETGAEDSDEFAEIPPFLVTFEGSARGLHLDNIDAVFIVGRPTSAASYLHLAGRVGRAAVGEDGGLTVRPGVVVSFCTRGSAIELGKWCKAVGGSELEEMVL